MSVSSVLKQFKSDAQLLGLSENLYLTQLVFNAHDGDQDAIDKLEEMRDTAVDQQDIDFFQALLDISRRVHDTLRLDSPVAVSIKNYAAYASLVQNDDGGWDWFENADSTNVRDRSSVSFANQFGSTPLVLLNIFNVFKDLDYLESARKSMEARLGVAVDPFNRFFPDVTEMFVTLGISGPMQFTDYLDKGIEANDAEINFYKTIQRWHDLGNGPNPNPPVGNGADGNLLDLWNNDNAACRAVSLSDAATRLNDRFAAAGRIPNIRMYDINSRIRISQALSDNGDTIDGQDYGDFALALANICKDIVYPGLDWVTGPGTWWPLLGISNAVLIFKRYEAQPGFSVVLDSALTLLKSFKITGSSTPDIDGLYGVDNPLGSEGWFSGDKQEQGYTLQALVATGEFDAARDLANLIINNFQQDSGNYVADIFDYFFGATYVQEANSNIAKGLFEAWENKVIK
jgi:hypothetical protein